MTVYVFLNAVAEAHFIDLTYVFTHDGNPYFSVVEDGAHFIDLPHIFPHEDNPFFFAIENGAHLLNYPI
jgi:hypothetical protein